MSTANLAASATRRKSTALTTAADNQGYVDTTTPVRPSPPRPSLLLEGLADSITSSYAPDIILAGEPLDLDDDLPALAAAALDRIVGSDCEWRDLWGEGGATEFPQIDRLRAVLSEPPEIPGKTELRSPSGAAAAPVRCH